MNISPLLKEKIPSEIDSIISIAARLADEASVPIALVGGVVRDLLTEQPVRDADIMLKHPAHPLVLKLAETLKARLVTHERFFTFSLHMPSGFKMDVVTARQETYPIQGQLPHVVPSTYENDLHRRDFTINAMACYLNKERYGEVLDVFGGSKDIDAKLIRVLHDQSFQDDPTRVLRAARFASRLGFSIEKNTSNLIMDAVSASLISTLSPVRRRHEFELILKEPDPKKSLEMLSQWGGLAQILMAWEKADPQKLIFSDRQTLDERLVVWFSQWKKQEAETQMTDLQFEKPVKRLVLSKLVQSSTKP